MNSRNSVNETNLVDFSTDLASINQLDTKDGILTFPFDHIYACHSASSERTPTLQLEKEVEISTHCVGNEEKDLASTTSEVSRLSEKLATSENQNKKLKDLLIYHLDLIQQQNELLTKRDKLYQALKQENDSLKTKLNRRVTASQRHTVNNPTVVVPPPVTTSTVVKTEPSPQIMLNSFTELLIPDNRTNSFTYESDINKNKTFGQDFTIKKPETDISYLPAVTSILDSNLNTESYKMIENKRLIVKKEVKTEPKPEPLYTVTTNSGMPVIQGIQRNRRRTTGVGSMNRLNRPSAPKTETCENKSFDDDKSFDQAFGLNKKNKMINTYGKSKTTPKRTLHQYTGSLTDRLQLIDTTPTGEDPYQLGEAEMREQSPIPKLMLAKSNRVRTNRLINETTTSRLVYDPPTTETSTNSSTKVKIDRFNFTGPFSKVATKKTETVIVEEPDLDIVKTEPEIDWTIYSQKSGNETSLCDFSYGETPNNLASNILPTIDFQELFNTSEGLKLEISPINKPEFNATGKTTTDKSKRTGSKTTSLVTPSADLMGSKTTPENKKGGRKRAFSTGPGKGIKKESVQKPVASKPKLAKGKGKKSPVPGLVSKKPYHTLVGDPDLSWYLGLDPDIKIEDIDPSGETAISTVEVPRWREKPYTSIYTLEGTENLDDKVFEKRHQKLEAEERRQLRWHMRRIREQRHVERLRQRQRDPWWSGNGSSAHQPPSVFTIWPQPQRDVRFIEITDTLPVMAFGEILPAIPAVNFTLPWVKTSKAQKRSKRSKTLH